MIEIISCPLYNAIAVPERLAWPETDDEVFELAHLLTGCDCEYVEADDDVTYDYGTHSMVVGIDEGEYLVNYEIKGTYHSRGVLGASMGPLYAIIGDIRLIRTGAAS